MNPNQKGKEECIICGESTGSAGKDEDSLYCDFCDSGPYCEKCFDKHDNEDCIGIY